VSPVAAALPSVWFLFAEDGACRAGLSACLPCQAVLPGGGGCQKGKRVWKELRLAASEDVERTYAAKKLAKCGDWNHQMWRRNQSDFLSSQGKFPLLGSQASEQANERASE